MIKKHVKGAEEKYNARNFVGQDSALSTSEQIEKTVKRPGIEPKSGEKQSKEAARDNPVQDSFAGSETLNIITHCCPP
jgi:hypothetical protein